MALSRSEQTLLMPTMNTTFLDPCSLRSQQFDENQYTSNSLLCCGDLNLDTIGMEATLKNQKLPLTKNEFAILKMLMEHPQQVFTKDMIYEQLWNETLEGTENAINVHISNLRKKIAAIDNSKSYIKTIWGIGFKMDI